MPAQQIRQVPVGSPAVRAAIVESENRRRNLELARRQQQIAEQQRLANLSPQEKAILEIQKLGTQAAVDPYGGQVVTYNEDVLGLANALGIPAGTTYNLVSTGQLKISGGQIVYNGISLGSSTQAETIAQKILAARGQTGYYDTYIGLPAGYQYAEGGGVEKIPTYYEVQTPQGGMSFGTKEQAEAYIAKHSTSINTLSLFPLTQQQSISTTVDRISIAQEPFNLFSLKSWSSFIENTRGYALEEAAAGRANAGTRTAQFIVGAASPIIGGISFSKEFITSPITTLKSVPSSIKQTYYFAKSGQLLSGIKKEPLYYIGYAGSVALTLKSPIEKGSLKIYDIYRTRGMSEISVSKIVAPEVLSFYEGKGGTRFPYSASSEFESFFKTKNVKLYGLPDIPKEVRGKPLGYSATPAGLAIEKKGIGKAGQFYSGKGVSINFLDLSFGKKIIGQDFRTGNKPYVYALYGEGTKVVKSAYEIKVPNPYVKGGAKIKKYVFPGIEKKAGTFYIPTNKPEVQAVVYGKIVPIRKQYYFKLGGRRVPIGEYVSAGGIVGKSKIEKGARIELSSSSILPPVSSSRNIFSYSSAGASIIYRYNKQTSSNKYRYSSLYSYSTSYLISVSKSYSTNYSVPSKSPSTSTSYQSAYNYVGKGYVPTISKPKGSSMSMIITSPTNISLANNYPKVTRKIFLPKIKGGRYSVEVRRFGKFKNIGVFGSLQQAFKVGKQKVGTTLAATFRVRGGEVGTPFGFYKKYTRGGTLLIEQPKFRLSTGTEKMEIKSYRRKKSRRTFL